MEFIKSHVIGNKNYTESEYVFYINMTIDEFFIHKTEFNRERNEYDESDFADYLLKNGYYVELYKRIY